MSRDFTYVEDLLEAMGRLVPCMHAPSGSGEKIPGESSRTVAPFMVVNIGAAEPVALLDSVEAIENALGRRAERNLMSMQSGDVRTTFANSDLLERLTGYRPATRVEVGVAKFVEWYRGYYVR